MEINTYYSEIAFPVVYIYDISTVYWTLNSTCYKIIKLNLDWIIFRGTTPAVVTSTLTKVGAHSESRSIFSKDKLRCWLCQNCLLQLTKSCISSMDSIYISNHVAIEWGFGNTPCICQTFRGAISLVLSIRCFLSSFNCSLSSGYIVLKREQQTEKECMCQNDMSESLIFSIVYLR